MGTRGALQCVPVAQGDASATASPLISDQGVSTHHCANTGWGCVWFQGRHYLSSSEKWPCSVSMGRNVPTLHSDSLSLGRIAAFMRKIPESECLFFPQVDGVRASHTRGCAGQWRGQAETGGDATLGGYSLWLLICLMVALAVSGCPRKGSLPWFWQRQNCFSL